MNVLLIGSGGREHALASTLSRSARVDTVFCCPGNGGMTGDGLKCVDPGDDFEALADFAEKNHVGLTVVGPEKPLCDGIVNAFRRRGHVIFGPDQKAAQLEGSKWFAKTFMDRHGIPTAVAAVFEDAESACAYIRERGAPIVVKADGLAAGKGVTVAADIDEALAAVARCFRGDFGTGGARVVIEDCMVGEEASILAFVDRHSIRPLASSQDHKRLHDGDRGPNTGGMGAYSPAPVVDDAMWQCVNRDILEPFLRGCRDDALDYRGIVYAGIMVTAEGPKVLEFNVRFGDPETQAVLQRFEGDLADVMIKTVENRLEECTFSWSDDSAVCVVMASGGYPGAYDKGLEISGIIEASAAADVYHAGTKCVDGKLLTAGGRVLGVTARRNTVCEAAEAAYHAVHKIHWPGAFYRNDIAKKAIDR